MPELLHMYTYVVSRYSVINKICYSVNIVAFDFLGHGESPRPNQPELYTAEEVSFPVHT